MLIPKHGPLHAVKYGNPYDSLYDLQEACYVLRGVEDCAARSPQPIGREGLVMLNSLLEVQCDHVASRIVVPKPDRIRTYHGVETRGFDMALGDPTHGALFAVPDVVYEVTVFSYFKIDDSCELSLQNQEDPNELYKIPKADWAWNLCIYSQALELNTTDDHSALFNSMFRVKRSDGKTEPLRLRLTLAALDASDRVADGPPTFTGNQVGIRYLELWNLFELYHKDNKAAVKEAKANPGLLVNSKCGDPSGCSSGFSSDSPDPGS